MAKSIESLEEQFSTKCSLKTSEIDNKPLECIPLLLRDLLHCKETSSPAIFQAFDGALLFRTIILHGKVVGKIIPSNKKSQYKFEIDDCTKVLPVFICKKQEDIAEVQRLKNELSARKSGKQRKDILEALERMLDTTRKQLDPSRISIGNKIFVFGRPNIFRGHIGIFVYSWDLDEGTDRNMELAFKDELIHWYKNKYSVLKK
ncbi:PREDICTED: uncharacterized protein LOC108369787 [Rhagoletis zephyria]|uniref:uncharacterized protein LOC108369787 n=1 Tax=Rhagoletis zephyria TaxID=28612 RepID=UPI000811240D|nr:PREDICTED: uncharacterized protein LOC108369787 [Rhagoletis zephyria]